MDVTLCKMRSHHHQVESMNPETFSFSGSQVTGSYDPETRALTLKAETETGQFIEIQFDPKATRVFYGAFLLAEKANKGPIGDDIELVVNDQSFLQ